jgi:hypothetical protein
MNYELEAKKKEALGEIGFGIMWLFVAVLIEGISYVKGFEGIFYHIVVVPAGIAAIYKFMVGIRKYMHIKRSNTK